MCDSTGNNFRASPQQQAQHLLHRVPLRGSLHSEEGSYLRLIDSCITQRKAQGPSRTCNESKKKKKKPPSAAAWPPVKRFRGGLVFEAHRLVHHSTLGLRVIKKTKKRAPL